MSNIELEQPFNVNKWDMKWSTFLSFTTSLLEHEEEECPISPIYLGEIPNKFECAKNDKNLALKLK